MHTLRALSEVQHRAFEEQAVVSKPTSASFQILSILVTKPFYGSLQPLIFCRGEISSWAVSVLHVIVHKVWQLLEQSCCAKAASKAFQKLPPLVYTAARACWGVPDGLR